ncbi:MAG: phosphotransferase [Anaerolineales bacterium]|nr:phosphotransferase [Anaerolineales bacterium]
MKPYNELTERGRARRLRKLALTALEQYDLDVIRLSLITNSCNGIFRVDTRSGQRWILRVTLPEGGHTHAHVAAEMDWLSAISHDTGLSVPRPLPARDGSLVVEAGADGVPQPRMCVIFSWVPGTDLADHLTPVNISLLGELSAQLHLHARTYQPPGGLSLLKFDRVFPFPEPVILFEERFSTFIPAARRVVFQRAIDWVQASIDRLKTSGESMRLLHGDLHQWNIRYSRGCLSPIDFEDLMWGWPVQDIATTLYYSVDADDYLDRRAAFEVGYQRVNPWPEHVPGEIDSFIAARGLGMANFVIHNPELIENETLGFLERIEKRLSRLMKQ